MSVEILAAGPMLTVQDAGRTGLRHLGLSAAGPMDAGAFALANALAGNPAWAAALEFAGPAGTFRAGRDCRVAVTGGAVAIRIEGRPQAPGESHRLRAGERLTLGAPAGAVWGYLAFSGGIAVPPVLGSRATHLRSGLGGWQGRRLAAGDILPLGEETGPDRLLRQTGPLPATDAGPIRVVPGPQDGAFAPAIRARLLTAAFAVTPQRDRMAMVLGGPPLPAAAGHDIISDGTVPGSVQVPGSGRPLVLMAESQTTGGYPKIATVIGADLARLAQMPDGAEVRFAAVTRDAGEEIWIRHARALAARIAGLAAKPEGEMSSAYLLSCDLVGGIWPAEAVVPQDPP